MKTIREQIRLITSILAFVILFQGCTVYKSVPVTIDHAAQHELKVKVGKKNGENLKFKRIGLENGNYYGVKKVKGKIIKTPLDKKAVNSIKEKDKIASTLVTIFASLFFISGIAAQFIGIWGVERPIR